MNEQTITIPLELFMSLQDDRSLIKAVEGYAKATKYPDCKVILKILNIEVEENKNV